MQFNIEQISPKDFEGNLVLLYGTEVAERNLPLSKREIEYLKSCREKDVDALVVLDRLPYRLFIVNFDGERVAEQTQERLRRSADKVVTMLREAKQTAVALTGEGVIPEEVVAFAEGLFLADYTFDRYKSEKPSHIETLLIEQSFLTAEELERNVRLWECIRQCRDWVNTPVADLNAERFATQLQNRAAETKVSCTVFDKKQIEWLRMGGLMAVNKGSVDEPRFVVLEYKPSDAVNAKPLALVGKGIMYDTGGLNLKPDDYMQEMKSDMAGAEGRIILADAIAYAVSKYDPELIIDAATLTGAAVRAIGTYGIAAMQQGADNAFNLLRIVGNKVYERLVEFPFWPEYDELIKSEIADIKNCGIAQAGAITAGKFLAHFARKTPYIHLDIAGVAYFSKKQQYYAHGASGYGIRLLYAFLQTYDILQK